ncbi:uncharacterized protein BO97DRAFT_278546 [Aspergillus homomorphus CBS 101889]|uniref:Uncharacterized protein n=1 Tax=Aspergillus homomorphus (strain CBS 101889) TaxID=1450537 RepID=A0A395HI46_ASPHC|nr:hypothetical protein BO97DRAFT_278546 [Aspergillus homomorphus CBS 101889]RAL06845.1 hypothetical protein BO97DRAFT_278546 [Aspergillus homomorphus CBS 101889]
MIELPRCSKHEEPSHGETCQECLAVLNSRMENLGLPLIPDNSRRCCGTHRWLNGICASPECPRYQAQVKREARAHEPTVFLPSRFLVEGEDSRGGDDGHRRPQFRSCVYQVMTKRQKALVREYEDSLPEKQLYPVTTTGAVDGCRIELERFMEGGDEELEGEDLVDLLVSRRMQFERQMLEWELLKELDNDHDNRTASEHHKGDTGLRDRAFKRLQASGWETALPTKRGSPQDILRYLLHVFEPERYDDFIDEFGDRGLSPSTIKAIKTGLLNLLAETRPNHYKLCKQLHAQPQLNYKQEVKL